MKRNFYGTCTKPGYFLPQIVDTELLYIYIYIYAIYNVLKNKPNKANINGLINAITASLQITTFIRQVLRPNF